MHINLFINSLVVFLGKVATTYKYRVQTSTISYLRENLLGTLSQKYKVTQVLREVEYENGAKQSSKTKHSYN